MSKQLVHSRLDKSNRKPTRYDLSYDELCNLIANEVGGHATPNSVQRYLMAIYKIIIRQLELNGRVYLKNFGYFEVKETEGGERSVYDINSKQKKLIYIKPKNTMYFKPSSVLNATINNDFKICRVSKRLAEKKKQKEVTFADLINRAYDNQDAKIERAKKNETDV